MKTIKMDAAEFETLTAKLTALETANKEQAALLAQKSAAVASKSRRVRVFGLGLVFGNPQGDYVAGTGFASWGEGDRMPRMEYQDRLFEQNELGWTSVGPDGELKSVHLTDHELLLLNQVEHPMCEGKMDIGIIRGMRRLYNEGRHSKAFPVPAVKSREYKDVIAPVVVAPVAEAEPQIVGGDVAVGE
jgi:hypothetical protein